MTLLSTALLLTAAVGALASQSAVPVKSGVYVRDGVACRDAPFAALLTYNGKAFLGPHDGDCTSVLLRRTGRRYELEMTCRAVSEARPRVDYGEAQTVTVISATRFNFSHRTGTGRIDRANYRLCPGSV